MAHKGWGEGWAQIEAPVQPARARLKRQQIKKRKRTRRQARNIILSVLAVLAVLGGVTGWMAHNALAARASLQTAVGIIPELERQMRYDPQAAGPQLAQLQQATAEARQRTTGPLWSIAAGLPVVGPNVQAMNVITEVVDSLSHNVLPELSHAVESVQPSALAPSNGRINIEPITQVRESVLGADAAVNRSILALNLIEREPLIGQLREATDELEGRLRAVSETTATAARAVQLLPPMLGADGPRNWLVLAQNNAEQRASGGIPGAVILVRTNNGAIQMVEKGSTGWFPLPDTPILPLTYEELDLFGDILGRWTQNVNLTPDFPRAAQLISAMWESQMGDQISGVLSMDPVLLQNLLAATGPVTFPDPYGELITLDGHNTANFLLSEIYARYLDPVVQDEVFGDAAEAVFARMMAGDVDAGALMNALTAGAEAGRFIVWSAVPAEQELLAPTVLSGALRGSQVTPDGETSPRVTVAQNIFGSNKIGYYLATHAAVNDVILRPDGSQVFNVDIALHNNLAPGQAEGLPGYVVGDGSRTGRFGLQLMVYAPEFGEILGADSDAEGGLNSRLTLHNGLELATFDVWLEPGETRNIQVVILSGREQRGPIQLAVTPGPRG